MRFACLTILLLPCVAAAQTKGTDYAFIVAVKNYHDKNGLPELQHAITDVEGFKDALLATGYAEENVIVLHDELPRDQNPGFARLPEKAKIMDQLGRLLRLLDPEDSVVVVLNGHGVHFQGEQTSHFCPLDADLIKKRNLIAMDGEDGLFPMLKACEARRKLLIAGMCRNDPGELPNNAQAANRMDLSRPERVPEGLKAFYSCEPGQKTFFDPKEGSYFFKHLNAAWRGEYMSGDDSSLDGLLYVVHRETKRDVFRIGREQYPDAQGSFKGFWVIPKATASEIVIYCDDARKVPLKLVRIPKPAGGKCWIGSRADEEDRYSNEDIREVRIEADYYLGVYEVTQEQFYAVLPDHRKDHPSYFSKDGTYADDVKGLDTSAFPVENVSWEDAKKFCQELERRAIAQGNRLKLRLPTEAEWEYACREGRDPRDAGTPAYSFGNSCNGREANCNGNYPSGTETKGPFLERTSKAASCRSNKFGLFDMHGNVCEWCENLYTEGGTARVVRGGSWLISARYCRSAYRSRFEPADRFFSVGFRLVGSVGQ